jgi:hypothetical protein
MKLPDYIIKAFKLIISPSACKDKAYKTLKEYGIDISNIRHAHEGITFKCDKATFLIPYIYFNSSTPPELNWNNCTPIPNKPNTFAANKEEFLKTLHDKRKQVEKLIEEIRCMEEQLPRETE